MGTRDDAVLKATTEAGFRDAVTAFSLARKDWTAPEQGWPCVIFDASSDIANGGQTYFCGGDLDELWLPDKTRAAHFATVEDAQRMIEECDPEEWLRARFVILHDRKRW